MKKTEIKPTRCLELLRSVYHYLQALVWLVKYVNAICPLDWYSFEKGSPDDLEYTNE